jgi:YbbR domain-containing protein
VPNSVVAARFVQTFSVPITTTGLKADDAARYSQKQAVVSVVLPRTGPPVNVNEIRAVLDLEGRAPGVYNVPIQVIAPKLDISSLSPGSVTLAIERIEERNLPVAVRYVGDVRHNLVVDRVVVTPALALLRAPTSELAQVAGLRVDVPLPGTPVAFDEMLKPVAMDRAGTELAGVAVAPNLVRVRATFVAAHAAQRR